MIMNNPLGREAITRIHASPDLKLHKIRVPVSANRKLFLMQMTCSFYLLSLDSGTLKRRLVDYFKGMLIS